MNTDKGDERISIIYIAVSVISRAVKPMNDIIIMHIHRPTTIMSNIWEGGMRYEHRQKSIDDQYKFYCSDYDLFSRQNNAIHYYCE